ncbi:MAG: hypothetical protein L0G22_03595 [Propionibacteriaceae bacterium]|nr:hypothetical protein [Propionibacteriaceae bacterium]
MAETRKHQQVARDELDRAIHAALGDDIRPFTPGEDPFSAGEDAAGDEELRPGYLPPTSALGSFAFTRETPPPS